VGAHIKNVNNGNVIVDPPVTKALRELPVNLHLSFDNYLPHRMKEIKEEG
jgi:hypothetical protein